MASRGYYTIFKLEKIIIIGPGGSSQLGNFIEIGPNGVVEVNGTLTEVPRPVSWNDNYNLLIIDNPVGTGFSIADVNFKIIFS